jgi:hypothetical protein
MQTLSLYFYGNIFENITIQTKLSWDCPWMAHIQSYTLQPCPPSTTTIVP